MTKVRLDDLKAALEKRQPPGHRELSEADYKRRLVDEVNRLPSGWAERWEDKYRPGILDLVIKLPDAPIVFAEGKVIGGNLFEPTERQFLKGLQIKAAGLTVLLIGWKHGVMYVSPWIEKADCRECFTSPNRSYAEILWEYFR